MDYAFHENPELELIEVFFKESLFVAGLFKHSVFVSVGKVLFDGLFKLDEF